eukprot:13689046-Alexandrium_andersonii.AAC.1
MADAVVTAAQVATPFALNMAEQFVAGQAGTPVGRRSAAGMRRILRLPLELSGRAWPAPGCSSSGRL